MFARSDPLAKGPWSVHIMIPVAVLLLLLSLNSHYTAWLGFVVAVIKHGNALFYEFA